MFAKHKQLAQHWQARLIDQHVAAYVKLGFNVTADKTSNAITLKYQAGTSAQLQKTRTGIDITTGEKRKFQYDLTTCKHPAAMVDPAGNRIEFDIAELGNQEKHNIIPILNAIRMPGKEKTWTFDYDDMEYLERIDFHNCNLQNIQYANLKNRRILAVFA